MDLRKVERAILDDNESNMSVLLAAGVDPNYNRGSLIRRAARCGSCFVVNLLLRHGADPHLLGESGASTLQLAVYSRKHWAGSNWDLLLSCCDSSQLADGAAVAIIFHNMNALRTIIQTRRCNVHVSTTLTGKTVEELAKGYKIRNILELKSNVLSPAASPRRVGHRPLQIVTPTHTLLVPAASSNRNLSPSVARFFNQSSLLTPNQRNFQSSPQ